MSTKEANKLTLEQMLDGGHSAGDILEMLAEVCFEKADHIETNWQDTKLAKSWSRQGDKLYKFSVQHWPFI